MTHYDEPLLDISLDDEQENENNSGFESRSHKYKDRKVEHKLTKYEAVVKKVEKISRVNESEVIKKFKIRKIK